MGTPGVPKTCRLNSSKLTEIFDSHPELGVEVFSRLPLKDCGRAKCVSKRWNLIISSPELSHLHVQNSLLGVFWQYIRHYLMTQYFDFHDDWTGVPRKGCLDFLPEKVFIMASSDGLLCCRSFNPEFDLPEHTRDLCEHGNKRLRSGLLKMQSSVVNCLRKPNFYISNPVSREWVSLEAPKEFDISIPMALAFKVSNVGSGAKLVNLRPVGKGSPNVYAFDIFSSEIGTWRTCEEVCCCKYTISSNRQCFVGSLCCWLTNGHHIVTFDINKEHSNLIKLPGHAVEGFNMCLGSSQGYLHFLSIYGVDLRVWMLRTHEKNEWVQKYELDLMDFFKERRRENVSFKHAVKEESRVRKLKLNCWGVFLIAFQDDCVFLSVRRHIYSFNFKTKSLKFCCEAYLMDGSFPYIPTLLPHRASLAPLPFTDRWGSRTSSSGYPRKPFLRRHGENSKLLK